LHPFLSMVESRKRMHRETVREIVAAKIEPLKTSIPYSADIERMGFHRAPLTQYRPSSNGAAAFAKLWREIQRRIIREAIDEHRD